MNRLTQGHQLVQLKEAIGLVQCHGHTAGLTVQLDQLTVEYDLTHGPAVDVRFETVQSNYECECQKESSYGVGHYGWEQFS